MVYGGQKARNFLTSFPPEESLARRQLRRARSRVPGGISGCLCSLLGGRANTAGLTKTKLDSHPYTHHRRLSFFSYLPCSTVSYFMRAPPLRQARSKSHPHTASSYCMIVNASSRKFLFIPFYNFLVLVANGKSTQRLAQL